jgi:large subunit ribosomal protein L4
MTAPSAVAKAPVLDHAGRRSRDVALDDAVFAADVKPHLVHEAVRAELNAHRGTKAVKTRGLVTGGRGKPWRQKGTGRARAGTIRAPQFTGGGAAFAVRSNFAVKVNRKAYKAALRAALSDHASRGSLALVDGAAFGDEPSTQRALALLEEWQPAFPLLVVANEDEEIVVKSFRNLRRVTCLPPAEVEVAAVVWARSLIVTEAALETLQRRAS